MKEHISFRVGGPAEAYVEPTVEELRSLLAFAKEEGIKALILGNGSNVLVKDEGIRGLVIAIGRPMAEIRIEGEEVVAQAGALLSSVAKAACDAGLSGLEFAGGIPGSVGGAVVMNAGAYGGEIADVLVAVKTIDADGQTISYAVSQLDLSYRHSRFVDIPGETITEARFRLQKGDREAIRERMQEFNRRRREKQPLEYPSAGSTFKRPTGYFAGKLIEEAGLSGFRVGGAMVSDKHCGFVINAGGATAADILAVIAHVKEEVERTSGVRLEEEVRIV
ncbi:MAG: UDP-N-acetylmuramate dehydrogenase [Lachnospiraceae bacterium]|nr:UDP-N-acetylmuramate dehydrogenase [Lachnospiraceae bacterium]